MLVAAETIHAPMSWLKAAAPSNMEAMFVTLEVTQPPISSSKLPLL
jgi:hypothetical protein